MVHKVYKHIDAWRGYYTYEPTVDDVKIGSSDDAVLTECQFVPHEQNDAFIKTTKHLLSKHFDINIRSGETSNVFSRNIIVIAKPKRTWTKGLKSMAKEVDNLFVDKYTEGFSIMSGDTYPIDMEGYTKRLKEIVDKVKE